MKSVPHSSKYPGLHGWSDDQCERMIANASEHERQRLLKEVLAVEPSVGPWGVILDPQFTIDHWGSARGATKVEFTVRSEVFIYWMTPSHDFRDMHLQRLMEKMERRARHYA